jgi:hypothetical protein
MYPEPGIFSIFPENCNKSLKRFPLKISTLLQKESYILHWLMFSFFCEFIFSISKQTYWDSWYYCLFWEWKSELRIVLKELKQFSAQWLEINPKKLRIFIHKTKKKQSDIKIQKFQFFGWIQLMVLVSQFKDYLSSLLSLTISKVLVQLIRFNFE